MKFSHNMFAVLFLGIAFFSPNLSAQNSKYSGWLFSSHTQKISGKLSYMTDFQLRSGPKFNYLQNVLLRPGLLYQLTKEQSVGIGYTYFSTWDKSEEPNIFEPENRIFEQYIHKYENGRLYLSNRIRIEQRFIQTEKENVFAQRARHQIQTRFRLSSDTAFEKGFYVNLQNEIFLNIQNKHKLNNNFFDQNRPYLGIGYRINKKIETEIGYYYRFQKMIETDLKENIFQVMIITDL